MEIHITVILPLPQGRNGKGQYRPQSYAPRGLVYGGGILIISNISSHHSCHMTVLFDQDLPD